MLQVHIVGILTLALTLLLSIAAMIYLLPEVVVDHSSRLVISHHGFAHHLEQRSLVTLDLYLLLALNVLLLFQHAGQLSHFGLQGLVLGFDGGHLVF